MRAGCGLLLHSFSSSSCESLLLPSASWIITSIPPDDHLLCCRRCRRSIAVTPRVVVRVQPPLLPNLSKCSCCGRGIVPAAGSTNASTALVVVPNLRRPLAMDGESSCRTSALVRLAAYCSHEGSAATKRIHFEARPQLSEAKPSSAPRGRFSGSFSSPRGTAVLARRSCLASP